MTRRPNKRAAAVIARSLVATLGSPAYAAAGDDDERAYLLLLDLCEHLHPLGVFTVPSRWQLVEEVKRLARDAEIRAAFDGRNYAELACRYRLSERRVRSIIGTRGWRPRES